MLSTAYIYSLFSDKNRKTPFEFFKSAVKTKKSSEKQSSDAKFDDTKNETTPNTTSSSDKEDLTTEEIVLLSIMILFELIILFIAISMAFAVGRNKAQLFLHLLAAVLFPLPYIIVNTVLGTDVYFNYTEGKRQTVKYGTRTSSSSKYV